MPDNFSYDFRKFTVNDNLSEKAGTQWLGIKSFEIILSTISASGQLNLQISRELSPSYLSV